MNTVDLVKNIEEVITDIKGKDIVAIDVSKTSTVTDTYVICTGTSTRHTCAIASRLEEKLHQLGISTHGVEGENPGDWVLLDIGNVVVHVLVPQAREMYQLEKLYTTTV